LKKTSRLVLVSEGLNGQDGGIQRISRQILQSVSRTSLPTEIWSSNDRRPDPLDGHVRIKAFERRYARMLAEACFCRDLPESCQLVSCWHLGLAPVAALLAGRLRAPFDVFLHGMEAWKRLSWAQHMALSRARRIGANSHFTVNRFRERHPQHAHLPCVVIPLGLSPEFVKASEKVSPSSGPPYLLTVTRHAETYKGMRTLLGAFAKTRQHHPDLRLVSVGDGPLLEQHKIEASSLGLSDAVHFTGRISDEELSKWYAGCAMFVLLSEGEGFGIVFLEAMHHGKAVIATHASAAGEIVVDESTGLLVPPHDEAAAARVIERLLMNPAQARQMGENGFQRVHEQFMPEHFETRLKKYFDE